MLLHTFEKPDKNRLKDQECLICLDSIDVEMNTIVQLPCKCSNAIYHISCIQRLLESGENKNFCPHCKTNYEIINAEVQIVAERQQEQPHLRKYIFIFLIHIFSNTIMNIINIGFLSEMPLRCVRSCDVPIADIISKILLVFCFCKLLLNACFMFTLRDDCDRIKTHLCISYVFQTILFGLLICLLCSVKMNFISIVILSNNIIFYVCDFAFRISIEHFS